MKRLLVLRALGLGDLLTAVPALRALADEFPDHLKLLAAPAWLSPLARLTGAVDEVVPTQALGPIASRRPEVAVNLHGRGPESHRRLLEIDPERVIWFENPEIPESQGSPRWREDEHEVARWCRLLEESGIPADPSRLGIAPPRVAPPAGARGATLLHPGAAYGSRRWPAERWAEVARAELAAGRSVLITAGRGEEMLALAVANLAGLPESSVHSGQDLLGLAALVSAAGRVASSDTGVAHLATALGRPSVILFGPTPPSLWGPPAGDRRHRVLWAGSVGDPFADQPDPGLLEIRSEQVVAALQEVGSG